MLGFFLVMTVPPRSSRPVTLFPYTTTCRAALLRARLRRPLVQPPHSGARPLHGGGPALRHRRRPAPPLARLLRGHRTAQSPQPLRLRPGHLRRGRQLPARGLGRIHPPLGPLGRDLGRRAGPPGRPPRPPTSGPNGTASRRARVGQYVLISVVADS